MVFMVSSLNGASAFGLELFFLGTIFHRWSKGLYWSGKKRGGWFLILVLRIIGKCLVLPSIHDFIPLIAAGALPFSVGKKYQCRGGTTRP
jgi:hypothetical protein